MVLVDDEVAIVEYDPTWPEIFVALRDQLGTISPQARIVHVGSTAVPGLAAKPIIDISVGLPAGSSLDVEPAEQIGLLFRAVNPESVLFAFYDPAPPTRLANVHVRYVGDDSERWDILFRDFLRANPDVAADYAAAKRSAARDVSGRGRDQYSRFKGEFLRPWWERIERGRPNDDGPSRPSDRARWP